MRVSTKGRYGLRILLDIAIYRECDKPRMIREIAANQEISEKYISRLIIKLRQAGFIKSVRGANGGYVLNREPETINILDVLEVMEGRINIVGCDTEEVKGCPRLSFCPAKKMWSAINEDIRAAFAKYTLQDLLAYYTEYGSKALDYCI